MYGTVHSRMPHPSTIRPALVRIIQRLAAAGVGAITVLGSTGAGAYLDRAERTRVVRLAVDAAGEVPVHAGVSALRTAHALAEDAAAPGCLPRPLLGSGPRTGRRWPTSSTACWTAGPRRAPGLRMLAACR